MSKSRMNLSKIYRQGYSQTLQERAANVSSFVDDLKNRDELTYHRIIDSPADRLVSVYNEKTGKTSKMLMFGSNNYLGFANHPYVKKKVKEAILNYGAGIGGPPLLNGNLILKEELEERLSALKHKEATLIYPSGYAANLGLVASIAQSGDDIIYDSNSHASFCDGIKLSGARGKKFLHNSLEDLERKLAASNNDRKGEVFIGVEGVYSMDGDLAPLDQIGVLAKEYNAIILLDDAHGTCVLGNSGSGTAEYFDMEDSVEFIMGTFSKSFAMSGGFVSSSREYIDFLKYTSRPYMFSASLPPATYAAVLAGLDLLEKEPWLRQRLHSNVNYAKSCLKNFDFCCDPQAAIISLKVPEWMDIRKANIFLNNNGLFINAIEYPAVSSDGQRFRISIMAQHTEEDIEKLAMCLEEMWNKPELKINQF